MSLLFLTAQLSEKGRISSDVYLSQKTQNNLRSEFTTLSQPPSIRRDCLRLQQKHKEINLVLTLHSAFEIVNQRLLGR